MSEAKLSAAYDPGLKDLELLCFESIEGVPEEVRAALVSRTGSCSCDCGSLEATIGLVEDSWSIKSRCIA